MFSLACLKKFCLFPPKHDFYYSSVFSVGIFPLGFLSTPCSFLSAHSFTVDSTISLWNYELMLAKAMSALFIV